MKFPGLKVFSSSSSVDDGDLLGTIQPSSSLNMGLIRSRLVQANTGPPDELWGLSNYVGKLVDKYLAASDDTARLMLLGHLYFATASIMDKVEQDPLPVAPVPTLKTPNAQPQTGRGRRVAIVGGPIFDIQRVRRRTALRELFAAVAAKLAERFNTSVNVLPRHLEDRFGADLVATKLVNDAGLLRQKEPKLAYLNELDRSRYRAVIRQGRAYVLRSDGDVAREVPLDTTGDAPSSYRETHRYYAWGFVLSMSRELYVANHGLAAGREGASKFYHSSYFSGSNVLSAGDCVFKDGFLQSVTNLSGHYQPSDESLVHFLQLFKMNGADLSQVRVGGVVANGASREQIMDEWNDEATFLKESMSGGAFLAMHQHWSREPATVERTDMRAFRDLVESKRR